MACGSRAKSRFTAQADGVGLRNSLISAARVVHLLQTLEQGLASGGELPDRALVEPADLFVEGVGSARHGRILAAVARRMLAVDGKRFAAV